MPAYVSARYGDPRRYLLKALREIAYRISETVASLDDRDLVARPDAADLDEEWCVKELVGFLRESEREDLLAVEAMLRRDGAAIEDRRAQHAPAEHDFRSQRVDDLLWDFMTMREELVWTLRGADDGWEHCGLHPYRGRVPLATWVQEVNERDLDVLWRIQRLGDRLAEGRRRPRTR